MDAHTHTLSDLTDAGTAAGLDVPASGDAPTGEVVKGDDSRLTDVRTSTSHSYAIADVTDLQTSLDGKLARAGETMTDGANVVLGTTTGTQIGTSAAQKIGIWGATPVVQPAGADQTAVTLGNTAARSVGSRSQ